MENGEQAQQNSNNQNAEQQLSPKFGRIKRLMNFLRGSGTSNVEPDMPSLRKPWRQIRKERSNDPVQQAEQVMRNAQNNQQINEQAKEYREDLNRKAEAKSAVDAAEAIIRQTPKNDAQ